MLPLLHAAPCPPPARAGLQRSGADLSAKEYATSQREPPKDLAGVLDENANTLFLTEMVRGLALTLKVFFEPAVTVSLRTAEVGGGGSGNRLLRSAWAAAVLPTAATC